MHQALNENFGPSKKPFPPPNSDSFTQQKVPNSRLTHADVMRSTQAGWGLIETEEGKMKVTDGQYVGHMGAEVEEVCVLLEQIFLKF